MNLSTVELKAFVSGRRNMKETPMFEVVLQPPSVEDYQQLRSHSGLSPKTTEAAARGLAGTLFGVQLQVAGRPVAMGRVIGDGGAFYQVVDIAVLPAFQGQGLGKRVMQEIMAYLRREAPASSYVSLLADGKAQSLYAQFGFAPTAPESVGMAFRPPGPTPCT